MENSQVSETGCSAGGEKLRVVAETVEHWLTEQLKETGCKAVLEVEFDQNIDCWQFHLVMPKRECADMAPGGVMLGVWSEPGYVEYGVTAFNQIWDGQQVFRSPHMDYAIGAAVAAYETLQFVAPGPENELGSFAP